MDFLMSEKRLAKVSVVYLSPDLILSIVCGHVLFLFFVVLFFSFFFLKKKFKNIEKFQKDKYFILCLDLFFFFFCFFFLRITWIMISLSWFRTCLTLWRNLNSMCYISAKLFLILCEYVLVCTCTHGLIKKLIFLVCVLSIA